MGDARAAAEFQQADGADDVGGFVFHRAVHRRAHVAEFRRTSIARQDAVDAGLIKNGVRCAAYFVDADKAKMVDLEQAALRDAVTTHRRIKERLAADGVDLVPLLLVQVNSKKDDAATQVRKKTDEAVERLIKLGFDKNQIAVHTSEEPDADILSVENNEKIEVLVFKMSVALGFDAPRAFVLCSMRAARDEDFGVQLIGRILRVHRALQAKAAKRKVADDLCYGYVFLADPDTKHARILPAEPLPMTWESDEALPSSNRNLYGILPSALNSWEQNFAQVLDHDQSGTIRWWHRNQPHKPWAVNVLLPDGRGFFPDFLVGVKDRKTPDGVLLAEPKLYFERRDEAPKAEVIHAGYGTARPMFSTAFSMLKTA